MKKLLAIVLTAILALSLVVSASAATPISDSKWTCTEGTDASMYTINADGSLAISYRQEGVWWANCAILFDASPFGANYDVTVQVKLPAKVGEFKQGCAVVTVNGTASWTDGCCVKIIDYSNHPTVGAGTEANLSTCWELYDTALTATAYPTVEGVTYADAKISATGWNDVKLEVRGGNITVYINGVKIAEHAMTANGHMIALGTNGDSGAADPDVSKMTSYRNFKVAKTDGSKTYTAFGASSSPDTADPMDFVIVGAALVLSLTAAAFVMKARKA
ncbi:MAG: DUF1080 domain-containing protein [Clostridia bacterium]|nr:DUF1080 domain-containing protein [Clostridia bacterium]